METPLTPLDSTDLPTRSTVTTVDGAALHTVHLILPAFNEEASLGDLLERLAHTRITDHVLRVWIVDDGSSDHTAEVALDPHGTLTATLVRHPVNRGLGRAVSTGIRNALHDATDDDDVIAIMDADNTHDPELLQALVDDIENGADIAVCSRFVPGGDDTTAPFLRRIMSRGAAEVFARIVPISGLHDFTCGYRAYRAGLLRRAQQQWGESLITEQGFACMVELLMRLRHFHPSVAEVPMVLQYDLKQSPSKLRLARTLRQYAALVVRDRVTPEPQLVA